jgi:glycosyltransferase involved in cell wall biosynthesis
MITKDAADTIKRAIGSVLPHVDRVFVYDTGSTDGTVELLRQMEGVTVEEGEWREDFSWARGQSFAMAEDFDWIVYIDADDELVGGEHLRELASHETAEGFALKYIYQPNELPSHPVRLLRVASGWGWQDPCHELPVLDNPVIKLTTDVWLVHHGEGYNHDRNLRVMLRAEEAGYASSRFLFILGIELATAERDFEAIDRLSTWIEGASPSTFVDNAPPIVIAAAYSTTATWLRSRAAVLEAMKFERLALDVLITAADAGTVWTAYPSGVGQVRRPYNTAASGSQKVERMKTAATT